MYVKAIVKDSKGNTSEITVRNPVPPLDPDPYDQAAVNLFQGAVLSLAASFTAKISKLIFSRRKVEEIQTDCLALASYLQQMGYGDKVKVLPEVETHEKCEK